MSLDSLFYPKAIALIGASDTPNSLGHSILLNLSNQNVYPVNPNIVEISGKKCYPKVGDIDTEIDLAIIVVPAKIVPLVLDEVAQKSIKNVIIISSGFKEAGRTDLDNLVQVICQKNHINLLGPNCLGIINSENSLNASFATSIPEAGNIALLSQSGAICAAVIDSSRKYGIGYSKFISVGNKLCLNENNFLSYLATDSKTSIVAIYTEELFSPSVLFDFPKPVIVLKSGRSEAGTSASKSHTGALAGNDSTYDALFLQTGATRANTLSEFFDYQMAFSLNPLPAGNKLAIITNAGGVGVIAADAASNNNLVVSQVDDLLGDANAQKYQESLQNVSADSVLIILTPQTVTEVEQTAQIIIEYKKKTKIPVFACFLGDSLVSDAITSLRQNGVCTLDYPEAAIKAISALTKYSDFIHRSPPQYFDNFSSDQSSNPLSSYGLSVLFGEIAKNETEAQEIAARVNRTLALKISSPDILHKSDVGGVVLNVDPANIKVEFNKLIEHIKLVMPNAKIDGVLIEEAIDRSRGVELIFGSIKDPSLGQTIMVGAGGIYTEILKDVAFGIVPITKTDAVNMLNRLRITKILNGARGGVPLDVDAVIDSLGRLSQLLVDYPNIKELDLNPLLVLPKGEGVKILDYRIIS